MSTQTTVDSIVDASTWEERIRRIRLVPQLHGIADQSAIYARVATALYAPKLAPDFAYIHEDAFYGADYFQRVYHTTAALTATFQNTTTADLALAIKKDPRTLLVFRTIMGLTKTEFAQCTTLVAEPSGVSPISAGKVDSMERKGTRVTDEQADLAARTLAHILDGTLFGDPPGGVRSKQEKPDTVQGWQTVQEFAESGVPFELFLHQRHYGGSFRQILDATSSKRGNLIEDAVQELFVANGIDFVRTGSANQAEIARRFEIHVAPAPDFVVIETRGGTEVVRAMLECKTINDGGTARDKAPRFKNLRAECARLGGVPLLAVLGGMGWTRVNDSLGPVVRDTDGRVFTLSNLHEMLEIAPFSELAK